MKMTATYVIRFYTYVLENGLLILPTFPSWYETKLPGPFDAFADALAAISAHNGYTNMVILTVVERQETWED